MKLILLIVIGAVQGVYGSDYCEDGWLRFHNSCYLFSKEKGTWPEAVVFCKAINSALADIDDEAEDNFLIMELNQIHFLNGNYQYWLAGTDTVVEGEWRWITTGEPVTYSHWSPGQPSSGGGENCMTLLGGSTHLWNDASCMGQKFPFICKTRLGEESPVIG